MSLRLGIVLVLVVGLGSMPPPDPIPAKVKQSVGRGIAWLLMAQNRDGSWGSEPRFPGDIANTTMATLTLMSTGSTIKRGKYHRQIRRAVDWSLRRIKRGINYGDAPYRPHHTQIQNDLGPNINLYYAALLLSQILPLELDRWEETLARKKLREMTAIIASLQQKDGSFEMSYEPMLTTVTAWLCLRQSAAIGISIRGASVDKVLGYLRRKCYHKESGIFADPKHGSSPRFVTQASGLRVFYSMGEAKPADLQKASKILSGMRFDREAGGRAGGEHYLGALFAMQALHLGKERPFQVFYRKLAKDIMRCQNKDGSWTGYHCITARVFCTACAVTAMQTPNKLLRLVDR
jgi:prenyltransferase beta subunit